MMTCWRIIFVSYLLIEIFSFFPLFFSPLPVFAESGLKLRDYEKRLDALTHPDKNIRMNAIHSLNALREKGSLLIPVLIELLYDEEEEIRRSAAVALGRFTQHPEVIKPLIEAYAKNLIPSFVVVGALPKFGHSAISPLVDALQHDSLAVRKTAASVLGVLQADEGIAPLIEIVRKDPQSAIEYAPAFKSYGDKIVLPLEPLCSYWDPIVSSAAVYLLRAIDSELALAKLNRYGPVVSARLSAKLQTTNNETRLKIIEALGNLGPYAQSSIPALYTAWEGDHEEIFAPAVRKTLQKIGTPEALSAIQTIPDAEMLADSSNSPLALY